MNTKLVKMCQVFFMEDGSVLVEGLDFEPSGPGGLVSKIRARLSNEAQSSLLGMVVLQTLEQTRVISGSEWEEKEALAGRALLSGIKSNRSFMQRAKCLIVSVAGEEVEVIPSVYQIDNGGWFNPLVDKTAICRFDPTVLRDLLLSKLADCS